MVKNEAEVFFLLCNVIKQLFVQEKFRMCSTLTHQVPEALIGSLAQYRQPQYLTVISICITKLTNQQGLGVSERFFKDGGRCRVFGLLTNAPLPAVSTGLFTVSFWYKIHFTPTKPLIIKLMISSFEKPFFPTIKH